jgi:translation initiation factor IF-3
VKLSHAIDFLCEEMKVKVTLRFRGREMAHKEFGFQQVENFIKAVAPYGHPDAPAKLIGKGINVMISPLPRNKRAKNPHEAGLHDASSSASPNGVAPRPEKEQAKRPEAAKSVPTDAAERPSSFAPSPFADLDMKVVTPS